MICDSLLIEMYVYLKSFLLSSNCFIFADDHGIFFALDWKIYSFLYVRNPHFGVGLYSRAMANSEISSKLGSGALLEGGVILTSVGYILL